METKKKNCTIDRPEMLHLLEVARGEIPADLLIKNVERLDFIAGETVTTNVAIAGGMIAGFGEEYSEGNKVIDATGLTIVPGFIDAHLHIESSMMHPFEFERVTLPLGTVTAICDPHEITNVMGEEGFEWFLNCSSKMQQNLFVQISSCIPALPGFETSGSDFTLEQMTKYLENPNILGMAEMMNFPGVVNGFADVLDKIDAFSHLTIDGHSPLVQGKMLNAYLAAGVANCHETVTYEEGKEKLSKGMGLIIREGTVAKNLNTLAPLINDLNVDQCMLCTDDRNPYEIFEEGHINHLVFKLINEHKISPYLAYRVASYSAAKHFGLKRAGLISAGYKADFILLKDLNQVDIQDVFIGGQKVADLNLAEQANQSFKDSNPPLRNTMIRTKLEKEELHIDLKAGLYNVIEIIPQEIITNKLRIEFDGERFSHEDVLKIVVVERYGNQNEVSIGLVSGMGLTSGALASSVAHDSHNIIAIGTNDTDMMVAINFLIESGGGFSIVDGGKLRSRLDLPIAGLISTSCAEEINEKINELRLCFKEQGVVLEEPFLQMAFLALPVIPSLKITDKGLVDVDLFQFTGLRAE